MRNHDQTAVPLGSGTSVPHGSVAHLAPRKGGAAHHYAIAGAWGILVCGAVAYARQAGIFSRPWDTPAALLLILTTTLSVLFACGAQYFVHHVFKYRDFVRHNEVAGFIVSVVGTLYAVLLGFLTVVAWQHYTEARQLVASEAAATTDAWHVSLALPNTRRIRVRQDLVQYSKLMIDHEWPQMHAGHPDEFSGIVLMDAIGAAEGFRPTDLGQSNAQSATLQQLGVIHDDRQRRLADNAGAISWFEWVILFIGAACVICFCWLFGMENERVHLMMTAAVTIVITSTLVLLFELQFPFRTTVGIGTADWTAVINHIHWMRTSGQMIMRM